MAIQAVDVVRDNQGEWTHPDFPEFPEYGEYIPTKVIDDWAASNNGHFVKVNFTDNADPDYVERWFENGISGCADWTPECKLPGAFLLLIHETEDGPEACYFVPKS